MVVCEDPRLPLVKRRWRVVEQDGRYATDVFLQVCSVTRLDNGKPADRALRLTIGPLLCYIFKPRAQT